MLAGKKILIGVLNWGLGHASRSIQLIRQLESMGAEVIIASDGEAQTFLMSEFPSNRFLALPELRVHYASFFGLQWSIIKQIPKFLKAFKAEHAVLEDFLEDNTVDLIISDNRYGLFHGEVPSILLSHQINLKLKFAKKRVDGFMKSLLANFNELWIPDEEGGLLSGELSRLQNLAVPTYYMGTFSHFSRVNTNTVQANRGSKYLGILSGPEPLRSEFEQRLVKEANLHQIQMTIIRGTNTLLPDYQNNAWVRFKDQLSTHEVYQLAMDHKGIICRSGYSSLMDLCRLGLPALLVPTPAQAEQEYLARYHMGSKHFYSVSESDLDLRRDLNRAFSEGYLLPTLEISLEDQRQLMSSRIEKLLAP